MSTLFTFPHVLFLLVAVLLGLASVYGLATRRATMQRSPAAHRAQGKTSHRSPQRTYRLGGTIARLLTKDTAPPARAASTPLRDADEEKLPAPFAALTYPAPGNPGGYAETLRHVGALTGTTTELEQTGQWRIPPPEEIAAPRDAESAPAPEPVAGPESAPEPTATTEPASEPEPAPEPEAKAEAEVTPESVPGPEPEPVLVGAPPMELDEKAEGAMQRFEDAHRAEIEAAGDTTEQDQRDFHEGRDL